MKNWFLRRGYGSAKKQKELERLLAVGVAGTLVIILAVEYKKGADQRKEVAAPAPVQGFGGTR